MANIEIKDLFIIYCVSTYAQYLVSYNKQKQKAQYFNRMYYLSIEYINRINPF